MSAKITIIISNDSGKMDQATKFALLNCSPNKISISNLNFSNTLTSKTADRNYTTMNNIYSYECLPLQGKG